MIVPFPPGGPIDLLGRLIAEQMSASLGQRVFIENRPGAGATVGSAAAANAEPDGYTLLFAPSAALAVSPALYPNAGYDPIKSFAPIALVSSGSLLLVVTPSVPAKSVAELVAYAKANPGKLNYGSALGTAPHIAWALFNQQTGSDVVYIPYKGNAQAITDLLAGQVHLNIDAPASLLPHVEQGNERRARSDAARAPDHGRKRISGFRHDVLDRHRGASRHAARHRRSAQCGCERCTALARGDGELREAPRGRQTRHAGCLRSVRCVRSQEVVDGDQVGRNHDQLASVPRAATQFSQTGDRERCRSFGS
jgi:hypothetical protein